MILDDSNVSRATLCLGVLLVLAGVAKGQGGSTPITSQRSSAPAFVAEISRNRYLSFWPPDAGQPLAFRVTTIENAVFPETIGYAKWIASSNSTIHFLQCEPDFALFDPDSIIHVTGIDVHPASTYWIEYTSDGVTFSPPMTIQTSPWGDIAGGQGPSGLSLPDGIVSVLDIVGALEAFRFQPGAPEMERADLVPERPDQSLDIFDIISVVGAFKGDTYPFGVSENCIPPLKGTFDLFEKYTCRVPWYGVLIGPNAWHYNQKTYVVYQGNDTSYDSYVVSFDHVSRQWSDTFLVGEGSNDHGVPAILIDTVLNPGQIHVFYASHHYFHHPQRYARSVYSEDITLFEQRPIISSAATYPQPMQFGDGDIYLFYRDSTGSHVGQDGIWGFKSSADAGDTWSSFTGILDNVEDEPDYVFSWYGRFFLAPDESIHFVGAAHQRAGVPAPESWKDLFYMYSNDRGLSWFTINNDLLELPVTPETANQIQFAQTVNSYPASIAFDQDSRPYILAIEGTFGEQLNSYMYTHDGFQWVKSLIPLDNITDKEHTGRLIVESPGVIHAYASNALGLTHFSTLDGGASWTFTESVITTELGSRTAAGIQFVQDGTTDEFLIFRKGEELFLWGQSGFANRTFGN